MSTNFDPLFGLIQVSTSIKIKRSDGRIHLAKVVQLSPESKSVGVEWNEHGEVKGKEILLDLVFELNNELRGSSTGFKQPTAPVSNPIVRPTAAVNMPSSGLSSSRLTLDIDTLEREYNSRPPPTLPPQLLQKIQQHPVSIQTTSTPLPAPPLNGYRRETRSSADTDRTRTIILGRSPALLHILRQVMRHRARAVRTLHVRFVVQRDKQRAHRARRYRNCPRRLLLFHLRH
jgi:hypothetical protein